MMMRMMLLLVMMRRIARIALKDAAPIYWSLPLEPRRGSLKRDGSTRVELYMAAVLGPGPSGASPSAPCEGVLAETCLVLHMYNRVDGDGNKTCTFQLPSYSPRTAFMSPDGRGEPLQKSPAGQREEPLHLGSGKPSPQGEITMQ